MRGKENSPLDASFEMNIRINNWNDTVLKIKYYIIIAFHKEYLYVFIDTT